MNVVLYFEGREYLK